MATMHRRRRGSAPLPSLAAGLAVLWLWPGTSVAQTSADEAELFERLNTREQILDGQRSASEAVTRQRGLLAYRLGRRLELGFAANPENRLDDARAFDAALLALRRSAAETVTLSRALDRVRVERGLVETAFVARATGERGKETDESISARPALPGRVVRPVRGEAVAFPGTRRDGPTRVELRHDGVAMLARLNEPVRAITAGTVERVEALPQGGFAVVTSHASGWTSIVSGLRDITVRAGDRVEAGATLGLAGRNLDGAAVVSVEIWKNRHAQDAGRLLRARPAAGS
jgi:murein DD-endopeptidase MepM/ murein hydrolase activator NlpD